MTVFSAFAAMGLSLLGNLPQADAAKKSVVPTTKYQMPFPCADTWKGSTRSGHSPSSKSVDFNKAGDLGAPTVAAAAGTVTTAQTANKGGYGRYVVIDHGGGESSVYAHLDKVTVTVGQRVDAATQIGNVGKSGRVTGPHLHFEEKKGKTVLAAWFNGKAFKYGSTQSSANCVDVPLAGTTKSAVARPVVYRRGASSKFIIQTSATATRTIALGTAIDEPVVGDWNGDGSTDVGVRKAGTASFQLATATKGPVTSIAYGLATDQPVSGDWDGDGTWEIGVYRASASTFLLRQDDGSTISVPFAGTGSLPVTGDFDGDGATDVGTYQQTSRTFTLRTVLNDRITWTKHVLGSTGDLPVTGDWDGDGITELGTWAPRTATFTTYRGTFVPIAAPDGAVARKPALGKRKSIVFGAKRR